MAPDWKVGTKSTFSLIRDTVAYRFVCGSVRVLIWVAIFQRNRKGKRTDKNTQKKSVTFKMRSC